MHEFQRLFGSYYVAGYRLGGSNVTEVSAALAQDSRSKDMAADVTFKVLGFSKTKHIEDHEIAESFNGTLALSSFDTLDSQGATLQSVNGDAYFRLKSLVEANLARARSVEARSWQKLEGLDIRDRSPVQRSVCENLCTTGIVAELLLLPFSGLRDYAYASYSRATHH